jgi:hypothetical protein
MVILLVVCAAALAAAIFVFLCYLLFGTIRDDCGNRSGALCQRLQCRDGERCGNEFCACRPIKDSDRQILS